MVTMWHVTWKNGQVEQVRGEKDHWTILGGKQVVSEGIQFVALSAL